MFAHRPSRHDPPLSHDGLGYARKTRRIYFSVDPREKEYSNYRAEKLAISGLYSRQEISGGTDGSNPSLSSRQSMYEAILCQVE
jgi:hypothetical protein